MNRAVYLHIGCDVLPFRLKAVHLRAEFGNTVFSGRNGFANLADIFAFFQIEFMFLIVERFIFPMNIGIIRRCPIFIDICRFRICDEFIIQLVNAV